MDKSLCSVIIPMHNCATTIRQTVESARKQSYGDLEILAIDDASTDTTPEIIAAMAEADPRIRLVRNTANLGVAKTRNRGFSLAKGEYIALLDGDDLWEPDKLREQIALMEKSGCDFCYTSYSYMDGSGNEIGRPHIIPRSCTYTDLLRENFICCSTVLLRAEPTRQYQMKPEFFHEDFVYWLELLKAGYTAAGCQRVLAKYRLLRQGRSHNKIQAAKNRWEIYRNYCRLGLGESLSFFLCYALNGLKKYGGILK